MFIVKIKRSSFYQIVYKVNGKKTSRSTGTSNKTEAVKILEEFKKSFQTITKEIVLPPQQKDFHSLNEFKKEYFEYLRPINSTKYLKSIELSFNQLINYCGDVSLNELAFQIIDKFISSTFARTQRGAHHYFRTLKAAFNKALEWNYLEVNPFMKVKFPRLSKVYPAFITEEELAIILQNTPYNYLKDIYTVAFYTGMRLGEVINMRWNWINFYENIITVRCSAEFLTKTKKERIIPMNNKVKQILQERSIGINCKPNEVVFFREQGRKLHQETVSLQFRTVVRKSNLNKKIHFHTLRHSFASLLVQRGVSLYVVKELLGHESLTTTQIYSHLQQQNLRDAVNQL